MESDDLFQEVFEIKKAINALHKELVTVLYPVIAEIAKAMTDKLQEVNEPDYIKSARRLCELHEPDYPEDMTTYVGKYELHLFIKDGVHYGSLATDEGLMIVYGGGNG
jgi:hypothetical protein